MTVGKPQPWRGGYGIVCVLFGIICAATFLFIGEIIARLP